MLVSGTKLSASCWEVGPPWTLDTANSLLFPLKHVFITDYSQSPKGSETLLSLVLQDMNSLKQPHLAAARKTDGGSLIHLIQFY